MKYGSRTLTSINHTHLNSLGVNRGEPAWMMVIECEGLDHPIFYLGSEFNEWKDIKEVTQEGQQPIFFYDDIRDALETAAKIITTKFSTPLKEWQDSIEKWLEE